MLNEVGQIIGTALCIALPIWAMAVQLKRNRRGEATLDYVLADPPELGSCEPDDFVLLADCNTSIVVDLCQTKLEAESIECLVTRRSVVISHWKPRISVKACDWQKAAALIEEIE